MASSTGDIVWISGIANASGASGWTALNNRKYTITRQRTTTQFTLNGVNTNTAASPATAPAARCAKCLNAELRDRDHEHRPRLAEQRPGRSSRRRRHDAAQHSAAAITARLQRYFTVQAVANYQYLCAQTASSGPPSTTAPTPPAGGLVREVRLPVLPLHPQTPGGGHWPILALEVSTNASPNATISPYQYTDAAPATAPVGIELPSADPTTALTQRGCPADQRQGPPPRHHRRPRGAKARPADRSAPPGPGTCSRRTSLRSGQPTTSRRPTTPQPDQGCGADDRRFVQLGLLQRRDRADSTTGSGSTDRSHQLQRHERQSLPADQGPVRRR